MMTETSYLFTLLMGLILGLLTAHVAMRKERNPLLWFAIGFFFGVLGLLILFVLRPMGFGSEAPAADSQADLATKNLSLATATTPVQEHLNAPDTTEEWYYLDNSWQQQGPLALTQLKVLWQTGQLTGETQVWHPSLTAWQTIDSCAVLQEYLLKGE